MSRPRQVLEQCFYLISRRCTQRQLLMRPDDETNNAYLYCMIVAALRCSIDILVMCAMSNHHHLVIHDRHGRYPEFLEHFHKLFARSQNALRGRWENFWAPNQTSVVRLYDPEDVIRKIVYVATNPVKDGLVEHVHSWPGVNGYRALITGSTIRATRPRHFFKAGGTMPASVSMELTIPPELGDAEAIRAEIEKRVRAFEDQERTKRALDGERVMGRKRVLAQSWRAIPGAPAKHRVVNPRVAAKNLWSRIEALADQQAFVRAYKRARVLWAAGFEALFPLGTYWLRRFAKVPILKPASSAA